MDKAADTYQSKYTPKYWQDQLKEYHRAVEEKWSEQRENLDELYSRDKRSESADRAYAIFWANIEVLRPAVYARSPQPVVAPRFKDGNQVARAASETLERCLVTQFDQSDLDGCMREVRDEFLRYGRGTARARLAERNGSPSIEYDHFAAADFAHDAARTWREVTWVGFRAWLTRDKGVKRFGDKFAEVPRKKRDRNASVPDPEDQAPVWEIWCRDSGMVHFIAEDFDEPLEETEPWLKLTSFWPCPRPAYGTLVPGKLAPVPDIRQYKDQIEEINEYTARIAALSQSLRLKGFYPAGAGEISEAIEAAIKDMDNRQVLVPVSSFAALGGSSFKDSIVWLPVDQVALLIKELVELRRVVIDDVYQITGISDIVRGQTDSNETATAQTIKSQWGSIRIRERQNELARFARDMTRISGEIIAENFDGDTIAQMSQVQLPTMAQKQQIQAVVQQVQQMQASGQPLPQIPPEAQQKAQKALQSPAFEEVLQFLADDKARGFLIDIETDSTIQPNEDAEKQRRVEFITAVGGFISQAFPLVQAAPQLGNFVGEALKFVASGFRAGRPLEASIDQLVQTIEGISSQPPPPDPAQQAAQTKLQTAQIQGQTAQVKGQAEQFRAGADVQKTQMEMQQSAMEHHHSMREMAAQAAMPQQGQSSEQQGGQRPVPGGPPVQAPDGHHYVHMPHAGGNYHRVVMQ